MNIGAKSSKVCLIWVLGWSMCLQGAMVYAKTPTSRPSTARKAAIEGRPQRVLPVKRQPARGRDLIEPSMPPARKPSPLRKPSAPDTRSAQPLPGTVKKAPVQVRADAPKARRKAAVARKAAPVEAVKPAEARAKKLAPPSPAKDDEVGSLLAHAVLLNGGWNPRNNFYSHVLYLRMMRQILQERGLEDKSISVFSADGDSPKPDLAVQKKKKRMEHWLFRYRSEKRFFPRKPSLINTVLQGKKLMPSKRKHIEKHLEKLSKRLSKNKKPLLVFVTDHGTRNRKLGHDRNNRISLWRENLTVRQYQLMLRRFRKRKVISVMSQCFSGSFAWGIYRKPGRFGVPVGNRCGFYATLPSRYAYGCFPETKLKKRVGHAYRFILAMRSARTFNDAHKQVLLTDLTPDVPHRSSDGYLYAFLHGDAKADGVSPSKYVDKIRKRYAGKRYPGMKEDQMLMSEIARRFGLARPLNLAALRAQRKSLQKRRKWFRRVQRMWRSVFATARSHHLDGWLRQAKSLQTEVKYLLKNIHLLRKDSRRARLKKRLAWLRSRRFRRQLRRLRRRYARRNRRLRRRRRVRRRRVRRRVRRVRRPRLTKPGTRAVSKRAHWPPKLTVFKLRRGFITYVESRPRLKRRLRMLYDKIEEMREYVFQLNVQLAALKRMELLFYRIAGRLMLEHNPGIEFRAHKQGLARLIQCEATPLDTTPVLAAKKKLPALTFDSEKLPLPSWFGISFQPVNRKQYPELPSGAVQIRSVYLNTPAGQAGFRIGDIIVAFGDDHLREKYEIRERVMLASHKHPVKLRMIRRGRMQTRMVKFRRLVEPPPMKLPPIVGQHLSFEKRLQVLSKGKTMPSLSKGTLLLFFWATWCGPCKAALPHLRLWKLRYASAGLRIVTSSSENASTLQRWLKKHPLAMPFINVRDPGSTLSLRLRVRATPTFVVLHKGRIKLYHVGFRRMDVFEKKLRRILQKAQ